MVMLVGILASAESAPAYADTSTKAEFRSLRLGFQNVGRVGSWLPVDADVIGLPAGETVELHVAFSDPAGDTCVHVADSTTVSADGTVKLSGRFRVGRLTGTGTVWIVSADSSNPLLTHYVEHAADALPAMSGFDPDVNVQRLLRLRRHDAVSLLTIGEVSGIPEMIRNAATYAPDRRLLFDALQVPSLDALPEEPGALESVDFVLLTDRFDLTPDQTAVLRHWVQSGGQLIVSAASGIDQFLRTEVGEWLGPEFDIAPEAASFRSLPALQTFVSGASRLETNRRSWPLAVVRSDQIIREVDSLQGPIVSTQSYGSGVITFISVDVNQKPLSQWKSLPQFYEVLLLGETLSSQTREVARTSRISQSGVSDLSTQMLAVVDAVPESGGWSTWAIMAMMAGYLILIGPIDYLIVSRLFGRPELTWVTFPLMIAGGVALLLSAEHTDNRIVNQLHVIDCTPDGDAQTILARSWMSITTPHTMRTSLAATVSDQLAGICKPADVDLTWSGRPEDVFGGMYREGGIGLGRQNYIRRVNEHQTLQQIPLLTGGSRGLYAEWNGTAADPVVESDLHVSGYGLLKGTAQHHLPAPVRDWIVVFGNRVYRADQTSDLQTLEPGEVWDSGSDEVYASDLKAFLCGSRIITDANSQRSSRGSSQVLTPYDTQSDDLLDILTMTSFYDAAGGSKYVGLSQTMLRALEVSDTIELNHAVLVGRCDLDATTLEMGAENLTSDQSECIIRLFLPVDRRPARGLARTREEVEQQQQNNE